MYKADTTVDNTPAEIAQDDAAQALVEATDTQESTGDQSLVGEALSSLAEDKPAAPAEKPAADAQDVPPAREPSWMQLRIGREVEKAVARVRREYEAMLAPIRESVLDRQAEELVKSGAVRDLAMAREYVRMKQPAVSGAQTGHPQAAQPRDAQGRFAPAQQDNAEAAARARILANQAERIKARSGFDAMEAFNSDPDVKRKVLSGEWDFRDVEDAYAAREQPRREPPAPGRRSNGTGVQGVSIADMSPEQFQRLQQNLASGRAYNARK